MSIIGWLVLGLIAGFIASKVVNKPALFMPTGSLPHILRSNTRVSLLLQGMNQNGHSIGCVGGVSPRG